MVNSATSFSLPLGPDSRWALFIDLDGTLLDVCTSPQRVVAPRDVILLLPKLQRIFNGAVVILSGRPIQDVDRILFPLKLPCSGLHGAERRSSDGTVTTLSVDLAALRSARSSVSQALGQYGVEFEDKRMGFAVHTRSNASAYEDVERLIAASADGSNGAFRLLRGCNVVEFIPKPASAGHALDAFLGEPVFAGRRPLVFGDDAMDVDAFRTAIARNGVSIAVGDHAPPSEQWVANPRECRRLLSELVHLGDLELVA